MFRPRTFSALLLAGALALNFGTSSASAGMFFLGTPNSELSGTTGPYVQVTVTVTSTDFATVTFVAQGNYLMTDGSSAALSVNSGNFQVSSGPTGTGPNNLPQLTVVNPTGTSNVDGFGRFNLVIDDNASFPFAASTITFTLHNLDSSHTWNVQGDVLTENSNGALAAAHVGILNTGGTAFTKTGFVAGNETGPPPINTPEPSTMALAGLGALGFLGYGLRRRLKK
jgi:hypothetical protein